MTDLIDDIREIHDAVQERCDPDAIPAFATVHFQHDVQRFQVRTPPPTEVLAEGKTPADIIDVMVRLYPKKPPSLPSIPLTPRQRLFLASNTYEDKEAALQELLDEHAAAQSAEIAVLAKQHAKTVKSLRKARADKKRLLAEWQRQVAQRDEFEEGRRAKAHASGYDVGRKEADAELAKRNGHIHEVCRLIDGVGTESNDEAMCALGIAGSS